ncbi:hypothetical protein PH552_04490 [Rhizobium sp. CNPSo 3968]|uniref:hypothetical protein n=1 Tax=Rhizobium sp. CNPSo 3968 TaxID=3021408 RepID=UPI002551C138|nr:hypothetical protein [Rhizobium sp. CNPSo 3968]MDK4718603.1 hypothetical protein [Rhizobium sp. CNPSo 3968]
MKVHVGTAYDAILETLGFAGQTIVACNQPGLVTIIGRIRRVRRAAQREAHQQGGDEALVEMLHADFLIDRASNKVVFSNLEKAILINTQYGPTSLLPQVMVRLSMLAGQKGPGLHS